MTDSNSHQGLLRVLNCGLIAGCANAIGKDRVAGLVRVRTDVHNSLTPRCDECQFASRHGTTPCLEEIVEYPKKSRTSPVSRQDHDNPVRFRNAWHRPLDDQAFRL